MPDDRGFTTHPSFGSIEVARVQGRHLNMVGVDYEQGHSIRLRISRSKMERSLSRTKFYSTDPLIEIAMSEVQFAQMITTLNSGSTPCTITRLREDGSYKGVEEPPVHMTDLEGLTEEVKANAENGREAIKSALEMVKSLRDQPRVSKGDLDMLKETLERSMREVGVNLDWRIDRAIEAIHKSGERTKQEIAAFADNQRRMMGAEYIARHQQENEPLAITAEPD